MKKPFTIFCEIVTAFTKFYIQNFGFCYQIGYVEARSMYVARVYTVVLEIPGTEIPGNFPRNGVTANTANSRQWNSQKKPQIGFFLENSRYFLKF